MFHVILFQPEIPPNTGNVIRLCANTGAHLHLIRPLGFELDDKRMRRAGLDYHEFARLSVYDSLAQCIEQVQPGRLFAVSTRGSRTYTDPQYREGDGFLFGPETRGLPDEVLSKFASDLVLRIPMRPGNRSLNLSNAAAVLVYEAWRQNGFV